MNRVDMQSSHHALHNLELEEGSDNKWANSYNTSCYMSQKNAYIM